MESTELDHLYGAIANALHRVGEPHAPLFLATLVLDLVSRQSDPAFVAVAIGRAERLTRER